MADDNATPRPGDWVAAFGVVQPPSAPVAPGAWDFGRQAYFQKIGGSGYTLGHVRTIPPPEGASTGGFRAWLAGVRHAAALAVLKVKSGDAGGLAATLLTGDRSAIPGDVLEAMRDSGLAHLLAISGLHIGLVAGIIFFVVRGGLAAVEPVALRYPIKKWAAAAAILAALVYVLLAGASIPTQRAFLMAGLVLGAVIVDRASLSPRLIAWAATVLLLIAPESLLGPSFQMTFAAAGTLIATYEVLRGPLARWAGEGSLVRKPGIYIAGIAITTLVAGLATGPFALMHFGRFADYGLLANLLAVPLTALWVMPFGVVSLVLMPFGAEVVGLVPMMWGVEGIIAVARWTAALPGAVSLAPAMPVSALIAVALGGVWICIWRRPQFRLLGVAGIAAGAALWMAEPRPLALASGDGRLMAVRDAEGQLWLSSKSRARFVAETWLRRNAQASAHEWPRAKGGAEQEETKGLPRPIAIRCDSLACIANAGGQTITFVDQPDALAEDCGAVDIVISAVPVRQACDVPHVVIDRFDLWRHGAHAVYLNDGTASVQTVGGTRGARPWAPPRGANSR